MAMKPYTGEVIPAGGTAVPAAKKLVPYTGDVVEPSLIKQVGLTGKAIAGGLKFAGDQAGAAPAPFVTGLGDFAVNTARAGLRGLAQAFDRQNPDEMRAELERGPGQIARDRAQAVADEYKQTPVTDIATAVAPNVMAYRNTNLQQLADEDRAALADVNRQTQLNRGTGGLRGIATDTVAGITQMAPAAAVFAATRNPALAASTITAPMAGQYLADSLDKGMPLPQAVQRMAVMTGAEQITESPAVAMLFAPAKAALKEGAKSFAGKLLAGLGKRAAPEGAQEAITQVLQDSYDAGVLDEHTTVGDVLKDAGYAGLIGAIVGGAVGLPHSVGDARKAGKAAPNAEFESASQQFRTVNDPETGESVVVTPSGVQLGTAAEARAAWDRASPDERSAWMAAPAVKAPEALPAPSVTPAPVDPGAELARQQRASQAEADASQLYADRDTEAQRRELAMASQGLQVGEAPESVTLQDGRPAPEAPAPSTDGIEVSETTPAEPTSPKLDGLREIAGRTQNPDARAAINAEITAEQKRVKAEAAAIEKQNRAASAANELRQLADQATDDSVRQSLLARADKLSPPPSTKGIVVGEPEIEAVETQGDAHDLRDQPSAPNGESAGGSREGQRTEPGRAASVARLPEPAGTRQEDGSGTPRQPVASGRPDAAVAAGEPERVPALNSAAYSQIATEKAGNALSSIPAFNDNGTHERLREHIDAEHAAGNIDNATSRAFLGAQQIRKDGGSGTGESGKGTRSLPQDAGSQDQKGLVEKKAPPPSGASSLEVADRSTAENPTRAAAYQAFVHEYQKRHGNPSEVANVSKRVVDNLMSAIEAKNADALIGHNLGDARANPASRAAFEAATGVKLPKGRKATHDAIDAWAGVTPEDRARREQAKTDRRAAETADREAKFDEDRASRFRLKHDGKEKTGKQFVDDIIAAGFDRVEMRKRGAASLTHLVNTEGQSYRMPPEVAKYARRAADAAAANSAESDQRASKSGVDSQSTESEALASKPAAKIEDFGEKIGGAKKDLWTSFREKMSEVSDDEIGNQPLSKSWPEPDYQALLDGGANQWAVAFMHAARDEIPAKPRVPRKVKGWAEQVKILRSFTTELADGSLSVEKAKEELGKVSEKLRGMSDLQSRIELYELVGHSKSLSGVSIEAGEYGLYQGKEYNPPKVIWTVSKAAPATAFSNWPRELASGATKAEALAAFKDKFDSLEITKPASKEVSFDIYSEVGKDGFFIGKKVGRNPIELAGPFSTIKEARAYRTENQTALVDKLAKSKQIPQERRDTNEPRVGEDMRGGQDVTPQMFGDAFGFRGVEFGNWVEQGKRQKDINEAYDALMDMAAILGVKPRALSLNGQLGLAFGARGSGGIHPASAHYEPNKIVINLTKKSGAGSLGHEWWHALDNYFSRMRGQKLDMMSDALDVSLSARDAQYHHRGAVRKEMVDAYGKVVKAIRSTALKARSEKLDAKRSKTYWTTTPEMTARAFESYLISKLQDQNASNDYLANIVDEATWKAAESMGFELDGSYPYPTAGEIPAIRAGFDHFFDTIQSRTEGDKEVLFRAGRDRSATPQATADQVRVALDARFGKEGVQRLIDSGVLTVVQSVSDLPADLGKAVERAGPNAVPKGLYDRKTSKAYIIADNTSAADAPSILLHEVGEHYGLQRMLGEQAYARLLDDIRRQKNFKGVTRDAWETVERNYPHLKVGSDRFIREVIAHVGETAGKIGWFQRIINAVRMFLRKIGITRHVSDNDIRGMVAKSLRQAMQEGRASVDGEGVDFSLKDKSNEADDEFPAMSNSSIPQTETPAFKKWFSGSKVVDAEGKPLVVYHGTSAGPFTVFNTYGSDNVDGSVFSSSERVAESYAGEDGRIEAVYLALKNPLIADADGENWDRLPFDDKPHIVTDWLDDHVFGEFPSREAAELWVERQRDDDPEFVRDAGMQVVSKYSINNLIRDARRSGKYDGVIVHDVSDEGPHGEGHGITGTTYVAFRPEQIKSATGNQGTFDPEDPRIDFSLAGKRQQNPSPKGSAFPEEAYAERMARLFADKMNRVKKGQDIAAANGARIGDNRDVYTKENLSYGKANHLGNQLEEKYLNPILKIVKASGLTLKQVDDYLYALHAPERNKVIAARNPAFPDGGSGMSNAEAAKVIGSFNTGQRMVLDRIAGMVSHMQADKLKMMEDYGLISPTEAQTLRSTYKNYVPLKTVEEDKDQFGVGQGFDVRGNEVKMAMGRGSRATSPLMVSFQDYSRAIVRSVKNDVGRALYDLAQDPAAKGVVEIANPADFTIRTTDAQGNVKTALDPNFARRDEIFATKVDGDTKYVFVRDPLMLQQLKKLGDQYLPEFLNGWREATSLFGRLVTQYNPAFGPVNAFRDAIQASIFAMSQPGIEARKVLRDIPWAMSGIVGRSPTWEKLYNEFLEDGAATGAYGLQTIRDLSSLIEAEGIGLGSGNAPTNFKQMTAFARRAKAKLGRTWGARALEAYNEAFENATRLSVYANARRSGKTRQEAAFLSKEIGVNFNKKGEWTPVLNAMFVFFNAAMQGNRALLKFGRNPKVAAALGTLFAAGILNDILGAAMGGDDDDTGEKNIDEVNDFKRDHAIVLPTDDDHQIMLPLPYGLNVPFLMGRRLANAVRTGNYGGNILGILNGVIDNFSPVGSPIGNPKDLKGLAGETLKVVTPTLIKPLSEIATNTNFYGGPIYKEPSPYEHAHAPHSENAFRSTTEISKALSRAINRATGGDSVKPGAVDFPPEAIDYLTAYYTGGVGKVFMQGVDVGAKLATGKSDDIELNKIPLLNRFMGNDSRGATIQRYGEIQEEMEYAKGYAKKGWADKITPQERKVYALYDFTEKGLLRLRKARKEAMQAGDDARVKQLDEAEQQAQARVVKAYNAAR